MFDATQLYSGVSFNTPMNTASMAPPSFLQKAAGALGRATQGVTPEAFAVGADMIGRSLDPTNAFAGVGTALGQGSLASKEKKKIESTNDKLMKLIEGLTGNDQPGGTSLTFRKGPHGLEMGGKWNLSGATKESPTDRPGPSAQTQGEQQGRSITSQHLGGGGINIHDELKAAAAKRGGF
jgi:hypothetical protein